MKYDQYDFTDLMEKLKEPGFLEQFLPLFERTARLKTIPDMIKKRVGLYDGSVWTYKKIAQTVPCLQVHPRGLKKIGDPLCAARVRECIWIGLKLISKNLSCH